MTKIDSLSINKGLSLPVYLQLIDAVIGGIRRKEFQIADQLPSINKIAHENGIARETVNKAFKILQEKGIISAVHGKGFFISNADIQTSHRIFLLFDTFTSYKEVVYSAIKDEFGKRAYLDIYFHHFNIITFKKLIEDAVGNYTCYIIVPFDHQEIEAGLSLLPKDKIFLIDRHPNVLNGFYPGIYQDFKKDVYNALSTISHRFSDYNKFSLVFRNTITEVPLELRQGFEKFCQDTGIHSETIFSLKNRQLQKGEAYLVIDDEDLVYLVEQAEMQNLKLGKNLGIISYNDTSLKKVVAGGISVISTDFTMMGKGISNMIISGKQNKIQNFCRYIDRGSF